MKENNEKKSSLGIILLYTLLMGSFIWVQLHVFGVFNYLDKSEKIKKTEQTAQLSPIKAAQGMYLALKKDYKTPNFVDNSTKKRTLDNFYQLRAYLGAPPVRPHPIKNDNNSCLSCHDLGGFTPKYNAYAPVTPHPEMSNCKQCHEAKAKNSLFKKTNWIKDMKVRLGKSALPGSPPPIPHSTKMRENCQSCHTGPAAVAEIRVSHPERFNCMQCHLVQKTKSFFERKTPQLTKKMTNNNMSNDNFKKAITLQ